MPKSHHTTPYVEKRVVRDARDAFFCRNFLLHKCESVQPIQWTFPLMTFRKPAGTLREAELSPHVSPANLQELNAQTTVHASDARILAREDIVLTKTRQTTRKLIVSQQQARCRAPTQTRSSPQVSQLFCRSLTGQAVLKSPLCKLYILKPGRNRHRISLYMMVHLKGSKASNSDALCLILP